MSFDFSTLVTDRTQADVSRVKQIAEKIKNGTASESELAEFNSAAMKGAYNYTDLNRVTAAMEALKAKLEGYGYSVPGYQRIEVPHPVTGGGSKLPEGYTELAWIESTGEQYVDTGFIPNQDTRVVFDFQLLTASSNYRSLLGVRDTVSDTSPRQFVFWNYPSDVFRTDYFGTNKTISGLTRLSRMVLDKNKNVTIVQGTTTTNTSATGQCTQNLFLLCVNEAGTAKYFTDAKLYSCQIYDNGTLARDFVPCKNSGGVFGLYDLVNNVFYQNAGSGTFAAGEEIAPPDDVPAVDEFDPYLWYEVDWPTTETMTVYLLNVAAIRSVLAVLKSTPKAPLDAVGFMVQEANDIEVILLDVYAQLLIMPTTFVACGEALCGGDNL